MVFYRKYRSQTINDLDSASVRQALLSVLSKPNSVPHAFLFTGPKGLGKTSSARIIAKVINCTTPRTKRVSGMEPCNTCDQCLSITNGTNLDIFEIDAASNRGIDEIRDLKEKIRLAPVSANKKIYIIDEVHMLTTEAFNALLKTLEEPPNHAMFILCTTEQHKVPETIMSRCFHVAFKKATDEEIKRSLQRIITGERIQIDSDVLRVIAQLSDGGFRDAAKMLEELSLVANGEKITKDLMENKYHIALSADSAGDLIRFLKEKNTKSALNLVNNLVAQGVDIKSVVYQALIVLHDILLMNAEVIAKIGSNEKLVTLDTAEIVSFVELFSKVYQDMKYAVLPQLPLELAIIEWCQVITKPHPDPLLKGEGERGASLKREGANPPLGKNEETNDINVSQRLDQPKSATINDLRKQVGAMSKIKALYGEAKQIASEPKITNAAVDTIELLHTSNGEITKEWKDLLWKTIISEMKNYNHTVAGVLRGCTLSSYDKKLLVIQTTYKFHKDRLEDVKSREALAKICKLLTGNEVKVTVELRK